MNKSKSKQDMKFINELDSENLKSCKLKLKKSHLKVK